MKTSPWMSLVCLWITTYSFIWTSLYNILRRCLFKREPSMFSARLVASIHALAVTSLAYPIWQNETKLLQTLGTEVTEKQADILATILGYILFDFVWSLTSNCEPFIMKAHHTVCIFLTVLVLTKGRGGAELIFIYAANQITNFLLQLRWFLRYHNFNNGGVEILFFVSFFIERIYLTFTLYLRIGRSSGVPGEFKVFLGLYCLIGYVFSYHVMVLLISRVTRTYHSYAETHPTPSLLKKTPSSHHSSISFDRYDSQGECEDTLSEDKRVNYGRGDSDTDRYCSTERKK